MNDQLYAQLNKQAETLAATVRAIESEERPAAGYQRHDWQPGRGRPSQEPPIATTVRQICQDLLSQAAAEDLGGCPLCQS